MKVKMKDAAFLRKIFEAISGIITETNLKFDKDEMSMIAMDGSHICLVDLHLKKEDFDEFEMKKEAEFGLNLQDLVKILKRSNKNDEIILNQRGSEKRFVCEFKQESKKKVREFAIGLLDLTTENIDTNQLEEMKFAVKSSLDLELLDEAMKDAQLYSEVLNITTSDSKIKFWSEGTMGDMKCELEKEELTLYEFSETTEGAYAIQFLQNILKIKDVVANGIMRLKSESPIHLKFDLGVNGSYIQYFLAPRVEEDNSSEYESDQ